MKHWLSTVFFMHVVPMLLAFSAFFVLTWGDGRELENLFMALYWLCIGWAARAWWRKMREAGK